MTKILIVDDHPVVLEGLTAALTNYDSVEIVGAASDGRDVLREVQSLHPEIVIMDIAMPDLNGVEATYEIKRIDSKIKVIVYTMHSYKQFLVDLMRAGISGYVMKQNPISDLYLAIEVVKRGGTYLSEDASDFWANQALGKGEVKDAFDLLSPRQREIFRMIAEGLSIKETAEILGVSPKTVEAHKYRIIDKLQMPSTTEWTKEAIRRGFMQI